ncbi:SpvB/TcaC N-terminal domain-containing protein [Amycolatopsis sp. NPDC051045]|uniref:SpvB/TcaC N-terminal domain-containing protein n=1 Tax=Amycolatopsis sp. NPDC051045 TaxID=3156922 RepID=UPI0034355D19
MSSGLAPSAGAGPGAGFLPAPALPKGGLAAHGIGERLDVHTHTGGLSLTIPFAASPGRGASSAEVALAYASGGRRSVFGWGWDVAVLSVSRSLTTQLPTYTDADTFGLSGFGDLVPLLVQDGAGWKPYVETVPIDGVPHRVERFRPRTDDTRTRIERCTDTAGGTVFWRTVDAGNVTRIFGRSAAARISDPADPAGQLRVYQWLLEEVRDDLGNVAVHEYKREDTANVVDQPGERHRLTPTAPPQANRYLKRIRYGNAVPGDAASTRLTVVFDYGEHDLGAGEARTWAARPDAYSDYHPGYELRTYRLCGRLMMFHDFGADLGPGPTPRLVRTLELTHAGDAVATRLTAVTHAGYRWNGAGYDRADLPPVELTYTTAQPATALADLAMTEVPAGAHVQFLDLDGDGLPGILASAAGGWTYQRPLGGGAFAPPVAVAELPPGAGTDGLRDIDGSSRLASVSESGVPVGSAIRRPDGTWEPWRPFTARAVQELTDPALDRMDLDGTGFADLVLRGPDELRWTSGTGRDGFGPARRIPTAATDAAGPRPPAADSGHAWFTADMSGGGLADLVRVGNGTVDYWPNLGWGRFGARVTMGGSEPFDDAEHFDLRRVRLADLDGTGTADLLYLGDRGITRYTNRSGTSWAAPERLPIAPPVGPLDELRVLDVLGAGTPCLLWTTSSPAGPRARYLDLAAAGRPWQLSRVVNNLGARTNVTYGSSAQLQLADRRAGTPWRTRLASAAQVVTELRVTDLVAGTESVRSFHYRDGYFDPVERELRGFARVETLDAETVAAGGNPLDLPPVRTVEWFHNGGPDSDPDGVFTGDPAALHLDGHDLAGVTGAVEFRQAVRALAGQGHRTELYADDGVSDAPISVTTTRMRARQLQPAHGGRPGVFRVETLESMTAHYEGTTDDPRVTHELTIGVDDRGARTSIATVAYPRRVPEIDEQNQVLIGWSRTNLTTVDDAVAHRVSVPTGSWDYEITGIPVPVPGRYAVADLAAALPMLPDRDYAEPVTPGTAQRRLISAAHSEFWDDALAAALPPGQIGTRALPRRVLKFALTPQLVADVYGGEVTPAMLTGEGGYELSGGRWWAGDGIRVYDSARCYLPVRHVSPFGNNSTVDYDSHLLQVTVVRASTAGPLSLNATQVANDYVTLAARELTDPHGVRHSVAFDPLGRVRAEWSIAPDGSGDTDALPNTVHHYESGSWRAGTGPAWTHTERRERRGDAASPWQAQRMYVDGLTRVAMTKVQAEPGEAWAGDGAGGVVLTDTGATPRWVGTGRTVFNNKGLAVEQYEPYFAVDAGFDTADALVKRALSQTRRYDPLGRVIRTDYPDGTYSSTEVGPWQQVESDRNDTVLTSDWFAVRTGGGVSPAEARAAALAAAHAGTPSVALCDALGRVVRTRADNGPDGVYETRTYLDIAGTAVAVDDTRGVRAGEQLNDPAGRVLRTRSIDAGEQRALPDALGRELRHWAATGHRVTVRYDLLGRATQVLRRDPGDAADTLIEYTVYGEHHAQAVSRYLVGQAHRRYDEVGLSTAERYDLVGNLVSGERRLLRTPGTADWGALPGAPPASLDGMTAGVLDTETFGAATVFDALHRPVTQTQPDGAEVRYGYGAGGLLRSVAIRLPGAAADKPVVTEIDYDAHRRQTLVTYGNGVTSTMAFDPASQWLTSLSSRLGATVLQDLGYTYDPVGNVVQTTDNAAQSVFFAGAVVTPGGQFTYDPTYRLRTATGREHASLGMQPDIREPALPAVPHPHDVNAVRTYTETYGYDQAGNITGFAHASPSSTWTRHYQYAPGTNRLAAHSVPGDAAAGPYSAVFGHDPGGNVVAMPGMTAMVWNHSGKLVSADLGGGGAVTFHHDGSGNRVRKVWQRLGGLREERLYLGNHEVFRRYRAGTLVFERRSLRIANGDRQAVLIETITVDTDNPGSNRTPLLRYQLSDKSGSGAVECDESGVVLSYEEYHPFGTTSLWLARGAAAVSTKRYRYLGKEKDEETGLYSFGARYYACWLGRWLSPDLAGLADGVNRYAYVHNNPLRHTDPSGLIGEEDMQMWFSEARALWGRATATASTPGFTKPLTDYLEGIHKLWGGPKEWDIGHQEKPFALVKPGETTPVSVENSAWNRSKGATSDKAAINEATAKGALKRDSETGLYPGAKKGVRNPTLQQPEVGGIKPDLPGKNLPESFQPAPPATQPQLGEQLKLDLGKEPAPTLKPAEQVELNFDKPAAPAAKPAEQLELDVSTPKPDGGGTPPAAKPVDAPKPVETAAPPTEVAAPKPAALADDAAALGKGTGAAAKDTNAVADVVKDANTAVDVAKDANVVAKDAGLVGDVVKDTKTVGNAIKTGAPLVKDAATVTKEVGALSKIVSTGSKVVKVAAPVIKVAAPVVRVLGEVAKPLGVGVAVVDLATAHNNSDRLVATGDLAAGVAVYFGPVGESFTAGYTVGGLVDKGIEKASMATVGVDLSPSNGIAKQLETVDKAASYVIPDSSSKPAYKNENKVAWFLIDTLGF